MSNITMLFNSELSRLSR